jgi:hypothetical protein
MLFLDACPSYLINKFWNITKFKYQILNIMGCHYNTRCGFPWVLVGSRRFRLIYLAKILITIASYSFLSPIPWLLYRKGSRGFPWVPVGSRGFPWVPVDSFTRVLMGSRRFRSIYLAKISITIASYSFLSPIPWLLYREGSRGFPWTLLRGFSWVPVDFDRYIFSENINNYCFL